MSPFWHQEASSFGAAAVAYLLGSIPFGLILTRLAGLGDIRQIGSGNIGATNVLRTGRRGLAAGTLVLDAAKGALSVQMVGWLFGLTLMPLACMVAVIAHCFPIWLRFRGGKGVATGLGAFLALDLRVGLGACAVWLLVFVLARISSAAALSAFAAAPVLAAIFLPHGWFIAPLFVAALVWWRHSANIARLRSGTEPRVGDR